MCVYAKFRIGKCSKSISLYRASKSLLNTNSFNNWLEGAPGTRDEPQHEVKGKITRKLLKLLNIKFCEVKTYKDFKKLDNLIKFSKKFKCPVACLIKKDILFDKKSYKKGKKEFNSGIKRETFLNSLLGKVNLKSKIISTTGYTSRELFQIRKYKNTHYQGNDFYMVGGWVMLQWYL